MKLYTTDELNEHHANTEDDIVCHITSKEQYDKLKEICPKILGYNKQYSYYLCSRGGYSRSPYYTTIELSQIEIFHSNYKIY